MIPVRLESWPSLHAKNPSDTNYAPTNMVGAVFTGVSVVSMWFDRMDYHMDCLRGGHLRCHEKYNILHSMRNPAHLMKHLRRNTEFRNVIYPGASRTR